MFSDGGGEYLLFFVFWLDFMEHIKLSMEVIFFSLIIFIYNRSFIWLGIIE